MSVLGRIRDVATFAKAIVSDVATAIATSGGAHDERPIEPSVIDESHAWPVPAQDPHTPASRALQHRPARVERVEVERPVLTGSAADRMRGARRSG